MDHQSVKFSCCLILLSNEISFAQLYRVQFIYSRRRHMLPSNRINGHIGQKKIILTDVYIKSPFPSNEERHFSVIKKVTIYQKYLEKGLIQMECDFTHSRTWKLICHINWYKKVNNKQEGFFNSIIRIMIHFLVNKSAPVTVKSKHKTNDKKSRLWLHLSWRRRYFYTVLILLQN